MITCTHRFNVPHPAPARPVNIGEDSPALCRCGACARTAPQTLLPSCLLVGARSMSTHTVSFEMAKSLLEQFVAILAKNFPDLQKNLETLMGHGRPGGIYLLQQAFMN